MGENANRASMGGHTPPPWKWVEEPGGYPTTNLEPDVLQIYQSHGGGRLPEDADARLIEAAPELLAENKRLREALKFYADEENWEEPVWTGTRGGPRPAPAHEDAGDYAREALHTEVGGDG